MPDRVGGLSSSEVCDSFECVSSPDVERVVKQVAGDLAAVREGRRSLAVYFDKLEYRDSFCLPGPLGGFDRAADLSGFEPIRALLQKPQAAVSAMVMEAADVAVLTWTLAGSTPAGPLAAAVRTRLKLNLITGRVLAQNDTWDLGRSSPLAAAYFGLARAGYTARHRLRALSARTPAETGRGDDVFVDPSDPKRFFTQDDPFQQDALQLMLVLAALYAVAQALGTVMQ